MPAEWPTEWDDAGVAPASTGRDIWVSSVSFGSPFYLAVTMLELAEWLSAQGRHDEASTQIGETIAIFDRLEAKPWLERAAAVDLTEVEI